MNLFDCIINTLSESSALADSEFQGNVWSCRANWDSKRNLNSDLNSISVYMFWSTFYPKTDSALIQLYEK